MHTSVERLRDSTKNGQTTFRMLPLGMHSPSKPKLVHGWQNGGHTTGLSIENSLSWLEILATDNFLHTIVTIQCYCQTFQPLPVVLCSDKYKNKQGISYTKVTKQCLHNRKESSAPQKKRHQRNSSCTTNGPYTNSNAGFHTRGGGGGGGGGGGAPWDFPSPPPPPPPPNPVPPPEFQDCTMIYQCKC